MVAKLTAPSSLGTAIEEVASRDPVLAELVARVGPIRHRPRDPDGPFAAHVGRAPGKILEIHQETPGRMHVVLIRQVVGF